MTGANRAEMELAKRVTRRVFFSLWPEDALRGEILRGIGDFVSASGGRAVPAANLHVTLLFLGSVEESRIAELCGIALAAPGDSAVSAAIVGLSGGGEVARADRAGDVEGEGRDSAAPHLVLDRIEFWKKPGLLVAATSSVTPSYRVAESLRAELGRRTAEAGFAPDLKILDFRPHVTLARNVSRQIPSQPMRPIRWSFDQFVLVESRTESSGPVYRVIDSFALPLVRSG